MVVYKSDNQLYYLYQYKNSFPKGQGRKILYISSPLEADIFLLIITQNIYTIYVIFKSKNYNCYDI